MNIQNGLYKTKLIGKCKFKIIQMKVKFLNIYISSVEQRYKSLNLITNQKLTCTHCF